MRSSSEPRCWAENPPEGGGNTMKWVTREHPHTDRIACPWLIRKFIDPDAEIVYVPRDEVLSYAEREGAISFDATRREVHPPGRPLLIRGPRRGVQARRRSGARPPGKGRARRRRVRGRRRDTAIAGARGDRARVHGSWRDRPGTAPPRD